MNARFFQFLLGILLLCSTSTAYPKAFSVQPGGCRAIFLSADDVLDEIQAIATLDQVAMLPNLAEIELSETSVESEEELKRSQKRQSSHQKFLAKCRLHGAFSAKSATKGVASHPLMQDALQQRTAAIRFQQLASLVVSLESLTA